MNTYTLTEIINTNWYTYIIVGGIFLSAYIFYESFMLWRNNRGHFNYHAVVWILASLYIFQGLNFLIFDSRISEIWAIFNYLCIIYIFMANVLLREDKQ